MVLDLNLHQYKSHLKVRHTDDLTDIWDPIRKKYLVFQPEELVRQLTIQYLVHELKFPINHIQVEKALDIHGLPKRFDIVVFDPQLQPYLVVECKSHKVKLDQEAFDQTARYNLSLKCPFLMVTNGVKSYCCSLDHELKTYNFIKRIPHHSEQS